MNIKEKSEYYRIGVCAGVIDQADAIAWVDSVIMAEDKPELAFIEASMCGSKRPEELVAALGDILGQADRSYVIKCIFKTMLGIIQKDESQARCIAHSLERMAPNGYAPDEEVKGYMLGADDEFYLVEEAVYGYVEEVTKELIDFLHRYSS